MEPTQPHLNGMNGSLNGLSDAPQFAAAVQALTNLIYIASLEAENPERVRTYLKLAEGQVASLTQMVRRKSAYAGQNQGDQEGGCS